MQSLYRDFSHLYIEESCLDYEDTIILSEKFPKSKKIVIKDYKEFFNRPKQNWKSQKKSSKIILAKKKDALLYEGSPAAPNFGFDNFYYNTLVMNCLYDCSYCYLQGMYPSANLVFFVNGEDFMNEVDKKREVESPIYLCISYDSDLLALESLIPLCRRWIEFVNTRPDVFIEIRTKSANFKQINDIKPINNVILAWTISPKEIAKKYETKTP
ncbi:MAG: hypothetical protein KDD56_09300, partial [Bdellovibrionales bacterium]|nr:hypothetical protein [Bdellovibrionales bacterium]